jgi:tRNA dimethylallyltransferase
LSELEVSEVIVIGGATGSGKTALAIDLALQFNTEIISADARQCYREMCIGTAVPTSDELQRVKHHFVHSHTIHQPLSAGAFAAAARPLLNNLVRERGKAIVCGGSGLYIDALLFGFDTLPSNPTLRLQLEKKFNADGLDALLQMLQKIDPEAYERVDKKNKVRVMRLLEIWECTQQKPSALLQRKKKLAHHSLACRYIDLPRSTLYSRINARTDSMMAAGWEKEARKLYPLRHLQALQTVGYKELFTYFEGTYCLEEAIGKIKQHTRNYAKRQITWFKNHSAFLPLELPLNK